MENQNKTDAELVKMSLQDPEHFYHIMKRYEDKLARYVFRFSGLNKESVEDILQETFIKAYKNLNDFDQNLNFSSWLYRITHNETINFLRKNRRTPLSLETSETDVKQLIDILSSDTNLVEEITRKELVTKVRSILKKLPRKYREILVLFYLEEKSYTEISNILKKPMGTIATLLNRAKKHFKGEALEQHLAVNFQT